MPVSEFLGWPKSHAGCALGQDEVLPPPAEDLSHLFDRFWRGDPARRQATGGSGLGLTIAHHIIEAHDGRLWAEPTTDGGLTVAFSLPTARDENTTILVEKPRKHVEKRRNNHELQLTGNS